VNEPTYIKLSVSIRRLLYTLKGAPGIAFMCLAFNEAEIGLGLGGPLSVYDIAAEMEQSPRTAARAVQCLVDLQMAEPVQGRGPRGEVLYRVTDYVSFSPPTRKGAKGKRKN
jgi:hypothetical protein